MAKFTSKKVLNKIKQGKIKMKPKSYFIFKTLFFGAGVVFAFLLSVFLISFIIFLLRASGILNLPAYGLRGIAMFFGSLPWFLIIFTIIFIIVLEVFAKRFSIVYRKPLVYSILGIIIIILLVGVFIAKTPIHSKLFFKHAQKDKPSIVGLFYKKAFINSPEDIYFGTVLNVADNGFEIETKEGESFSVVAISKDRSRCSYNEDIQEGDMVMIIGDKDNSTIKAFKIRKITNQDTIRFHRSNLPGPVAPSSKFKH